MRTADIVARYPDMLSVKHIQRFATSNGALARYLYPYSSDCVYIEEEFEGASLNTTRWTTNAGTGATAFAIPAPPLLSGGVRAVTGTNATASNRRINFYGAPILSGNQNAGIEFYLRASRVSDLVVEVGLIDTMSTITTPAQFCSSVDSKTFASGAGDGVVATMDTGATLNTLTMASLGSSSVNTGATDPISTLTPTVNTYMRIRVQLIGNAAEVTVDRGDMPYRKVARAAAVNGATLLRPWVFVGGGSTTSINFDLSYVAFWMDRP